jgi:transcription antitermination factor NusG
MIQTTIKPHNTSVNWFLFYTYPKQEKRVHHLCQKLGIMSYLPMHKVQRRWSDRMKHLTVPIFPNYVFVKTAQHKLYEVLKIPRVVTYISYDNKPVIVSQKEIDRIRTLTSGKIMLCSGQLFPNNLVRVLRGPFSGIEGHYINSRGENKLVIKIECLNQYVTVEIDKNDIEVIEHKCYT